MKIGINASFLRKPDSGIGQVTGNFINELIKSPEFKIPASPAGGQNSKLKIKEVEFFLYLEKDTDLKLPKNFHKRVFLPWLWRRDDILRKIWWEKFLLPRYVKKDGCDFFISLYPCPTYLPKKIRHTMLVHDMIWKVFPQYLDNWRKKFYAKISLKGAKCADKIATVSQWSKRDIHKYLKIPLDCISVAYPSVGEEFFRAINWEKDNAILEEYGIFGRYIFYIGGFDFRKNVPGLLQAYKIFMENHAMSDIYLVLGGEDKSAMSALFTDVKREIRELDLGGKVKLIGFVEQADLPALYRHAEIFVLPTFYEGFGLMTLEAMASGAPTAVAKTSSLPEVGGDAVLYFNPHDAEEMARVMAKIVRNEKLKRSLSEKGKERAKKFTWKNFAKIILEI